MAALPRLRIGERAEGTHVSRTHLGSHDTMVRTILPAFALAALASSAALADQVISVPPFSSIELHGGGEATLRHGNRQRVVLVKGVPKIAQTEVTGDGKFLLSPCRDTCWGNH